VRVITSGDSTAAVTRVLIESTDGENTWTTVGASRDIINASVIALTDSLEYMLKDR
ncbi:MAG: citramalate synthase, partial [Ruminiclostridium sp.]|nr:citramalate synthase [Ruminiclostridium sp.]